MVVVGPNLASSSLSERGGEHEEDIQEDDAVSRVSAKSAILVAHIVESWALFLTNGIGLKMVRCDCIFHPARSD